MAFDIAIVGLGNEGQQYERTRHNAGWILLDQLAGSLPWQTNSNYRYRFTKITLDGRSVALVKPLTMMNLSGSAVAGFLNYYRLTPDRLFVAHDDLDILLGEWKLSLAKGPKLHNGINSVTQHLGTPDYWRIRLGVDNRPERGTRAIHGIDYSLQNFTKPELETLVSTFPDIVAAISTTA